LIVEFENLWRVIEFFAAICARTDKFTTKQQDSEATKFAIIPTTPSRHQRQSSPMSPSLKHRTSRAIGVPFLACTPALLVAFVLVAFAPLSTHAWLLGSVFPGRVSPSLALDDHFGHLSLLSINPRNMITSMHRLEEEADRLMDSFLEAGALADRNITTSAKETESQQQPAMFQLSLRPSFQIEDHRDAFILTAATPGLNKEDISVDVVEGTDGAAYLIVSGHSAQSSSKMAAPEVVSESGDAHTEATTAISHPLRTMKVSYGKFERKIKLPPTIRRDEV